MTEQDEAKKFAKEFIDKYPESEDDVKGLLELCCDEIDAGESPQNELYLFKSSCEDLLNLE